MVKRDAPAEAAKPNFDITKELNDIKLKIEETFKPEKIKESLTEIGAKIQDGVSFC